ncbi:hypothetical protein NEOC65_001671 [Neochlamydia sp. AcF65]|nr:hypothetical protein [Neochlamydia sp. AcF65]MBS4170455.1 hypothetical protein [Neochlamydia sp. AcF95]NGY95411.1 hypothetical protein [Neochlamydia sp. AcF84]
MIFLSKLFSAPADACITRTGSLEGQHSNQRQEKFLEELVEQMINGFNHQQA